MFQFTDAGISHSPLTNSDLFVQQNKTVHARSESWPQEWLQTGRYAARAHVFVIFDSFLSDVMYLNKTMVTGI